ncbi:unnamed protein product [Urochloa humidicola]
MLTAPPDVSPSSLREGTHYELDPRTDFFAFSYNYTPIILSQSGHGIHRPPSGGYAGCCYRSPRRLQLLADGCAVPRQLVPMVC